jgi:ABC-type uncharacterized transport system YnjBCD permease subunit
MAQSGMLSAQWADDSPVHNAEIAAFAVLVTLLLTIGLKCLVMLSPLHKSNTTHARCSMSHLDNLCLALIARNQYGDDDDSLFCSLNFKA